LYGCLPACPPARLPACLLCSWLQSGHTSQDAIVPTAHSMLPCSVACPAVGFGDISLIEEPAKDGSLCPMMVYCKRPEAYDLLIPDGHFTQYVSAVGQALQLLPCHTLLTSKRPALPPPAPPACLPALLLVVAASTTTF